MEKLEPEFNKYAKTYNEFALVQQRAFQTLLNKVISKDTFSNDISELQICDIGCGTGHNTQLIGRFFPKAKIIAIDISPSMIDFARQNNTNPNLDFHVADAESFQYTTQFDLIISNASFQWFHDFNATIKSLKKYLRPNGLLAFSTFGPNTFHELQYALKQTLDKPILLPATQFLNQTDIGKILNNEFQTNNLDQEEIRKTYPQLMALLKSIKYTGSKTRSFPQRKIWTPNIIKQIENVYISEYRQIISTYQLFYALCQ